MKHAFIPQTKWTVPDQRVSAPSVINQTQHQLLASWSRWHIYTLRPTSKSVTMSEQGAKGDDEVTLKLSDRPKRISTEDNLENGTKVHSVRPRCGSYSWVVCFGIDDSTICEQSFNCTYWLLRQHSHSRSIVSVHRSGNGNVPAVWSVIPHVKRSRR